MLLLPQASAGQGTDENPSVVRYPPRSGIDLPEGSKATSFKLQTLEDQFKQNEDAAEQEPTLNALPACSAPSVRRLQVFHASSGASALEAFYYDPSDPKQAAKAGTFKRSVAYVAGGKLSELEPILSFASTLNLRCLPTLFHYPMEDGKRFIEFREGAEAWNLSPATQEKPQTPTAPAGSPGVKPPSPNGGATRF